MHDVTQYSPQLSIVIPVYQAAGVLNELVGRLTNHLNGLSASYQIILIDDGSVDESWQLIKLYCKENKSIVGIKLSRNFGQHYAITAGLNAATGNWVIVMDCDLQDQPEEIEKLIDKTKEGYAIVFAKRASRNDSFFKKLASKVFYSLLRYFTKMEYDQSIANFGIYHHSVIQAILSMKDQIRFFPIMAQWVGFCKIAIDVNHAPRQIGNSSYSLQKLFKLAINTIIGFTDKPLRIAISLGLMVSFSALIVATIYFIQYLKGDIIVLGFTSLILSIWFLAGFIIFILGIIGLYISKIFEKVKDRPLYIIEEVTHAQ